MKLIRIEVREVLVPVQAGRVISPEYGPPIFDATPKLLIEAHTDNGLIGLGEAYRGTSEGALRSAAAQLAGVKLEDVCFQEPPLTDFSQNDMFGHDHPARPNRYHERSFNSSDHLALHTALLDLVGKQAGLPVHALFGGAYRKQVRADIWQARMTPEDSARACRAAQAMGYLGMKCKCALEDDVVARAEAIKEACGADFKVTFDPNQRFYRYGEAMPMLKRLAAVGNVACVEDPFAKDNLEAYRRLRGHGLFPVALHLSYGPAMFEAIRAQACDYMNLGSLPWDILHGSATCWAAGIPSWHGSGVDLGIAEALYLHTAAAGKSMTLPSDIFGRAIREHNLITNPLTAVKGYIAVPEGPGLGVELDGNAVEKYTVRKFTIKL